jgi:hypothetical protein
MNALIVYDSKFGNTERIKVDMNYLSLAYESTMISRRSPYLTWCSVTASTGSGACLLARSARIQSSARTSQRGHIRMLPSHEAVTISSRL